MRLCKIHNKSIRMFCSTQSIDNIRLNLIAISMDLANVSKNVLMAKIIDNNNAFVYSLASFHLHYVELLPYKLFAAV